MASVAGAIRLAKRYDAALDEIMAALQTGDLFYDPGSDAISDTATPKNGPPKRSSRSSKRSATRLT